MMNDLSLDELIPLLTEVIEGGGEFRLYPHGTSMLPLLRQGLDSVALTSPEGKRKRGEILFYRRESGQYVLHRLVKIKKDGSLIFSGDHHKELEFGITPARILARVVAVYREEKRVDCDQFGMRLYATLMARGLTKRIVLLCYRIRRRLNRKRK